MPTSHSVSELSENPRIAALQRKHMELSRRVDELQKDMFAPDDYKRQLKKEKLRVKEILFAEERLLRSA